jgi:30S ribosomal protein S31
MGKGDRKTKRGKITKGTYGVLRPRKKNKEASGPNPAPESKPKTEAKKTKGKQTKGNKDEK